MSDYIWRFTNNSSALGNSALGDLAANQSIDVDASNVTVGWGANGPWTTTERFYIKNQTAFINATGAANDLAIVGVGTGNSNIASAELWTGRGRGRMVYRHSAS